MLAGTANINTTRSEADSEERISSSLLRATCIDKVGREAMATDWAMAASGISISGKARLMAVILPSGWKDAK